jgi:hypothetical protein
MNVTDKSIVLDSLGNADTISVQTMRSNYHFAVLDPTNRKGLLSGGSLGDQAIEAFLSGTVSDDSRYVDTDELRTGERAVFFVESKQRVHRLITSVITNLTVMSTPLPKNHPGN